MEVISKNRTQTIKRILNALEDEINEHGWQGVVLIRIAQRARVSKTLIYRYFGSLDGLMAHYLKRDKFFPVFTPRFLTIFAPSRSRIWLTFGLGK
ncbi:TetR/AcrR family transcriptional regulator [Spirosoma telluris]|uniref:TetR/AcrR family transcriptional regulator n=1 Tax=Spirosoma telluris TaxID=2183553 RepID=UPI002FC2B3EF